MIYVLLKLMLTDEMVTRGKTYCVPVKVNVMLLHRLSLIQQQSYNPSLELIIECSPGTHSLEQLECGSLKQCRSAV